MGDEWWDQKKKDERPIPLADKAGEPSGPGEGKLTRAFLESRDVFFAYILALSRDLDAAEDIFQEVALTVVQEERDAKAPKDFPAWCRSLCRHRTADFFRRRGRREREVSFDEVAEVVERCFAQNPVNPADGSVKVRMLRECLDVLGPTARRIIEGRYLLRKSMAHLADLHGWKKNSLKVALAKARRRLLECLRLKLIAQGDLDA